MSSKVILFNGSARKDGNTYCLLKIISDELAKHDIETEIIHVGGKQIQGCIACMKCWEMKNKKCILDNDPVNLWLEKMLQADAIILGSPVYCADLSGQIKTFIDRTSMVACANDDMLQRKLGAGVVAVRRAGGVHAYHSLNAFFGISQMFTVGSSYWNLGFGMDKNEVHKDAEGVQTMINLARNMAWLLKALEISKKSLPDLNLKKEVLTNLVRDDL